MSKLRIPAVLALALGLSTIATAQQPRPTTVR
jgi:hypothetical protein